MNNKRRSAIACVIADIEKCLANSECDSIKDMIEDAKISADIIRCDEQDCLDNMPENLEGSDRYAAMESALDNLEDAVDSLDDAISAIDNNDSLDDVLSNLSDAIKSLEEAAS